MPTTIDRAAALDKIAAARDLRFYGYGGAEPAPADPAGKAREWARVRGAKATDFGTSIVVQPWPKTDAAVRVVVVL